MFSATADINSYPGPRELSECPSDHFVVYNGRGNSNNNDISDDEMIIMMTRLLWSSMDRKHDLIYLLLDET